MPTTHGNGQDPVPTLRTVFDWYLKNMPRQCHPTALADRKRIWDLFCRYRGEDNGPPFGVRPYSFFRPFHLLQFIKAQGSLKGAATKKRWSSYVQVAANEAARMGVIERNPFRGVRLPSGPEGRDWTDDEFRALLRHAAPHLRRVVVFIAFSGSRPGEARIAKWSDLDRDTNTLVLRHHKTSHLTSQPRRIRLNHVTGKLLAWIERYQVRHPHIFLNFYGRPWTVKALVKNFLDVRRKARLPEDVRLHGGRHFFATRGLMNGVELATMAALLGHRDITMTMRYPHVLSKSTHLAEAAETAVTVRNGHGHEPPMLRAVAAVQPVSLADAASAKLTQEAQSVAAPVPVGMVQLQTTMELILKKMSVAEPGSKKPRKPALRPARLTPTHAAAYQQYLTALEQSPDLTTDAEAYSWLAGQGYELPALESWIRYVRRGRLYHDTRKRLLNLDHEPEEQTKGGAA